MSDHKRVGLHKAFSPSGLSAAPESNIHLAWCIPGLETLMWFVGDSRWQVHGSTLLTDSAGASGRVNNNTECLSAPSSLLLSNHTSYPPTLTSTQMHIHTQRFSFYQCVGARSLPKKPFGMLTFSTEISVLQSLVFHSPSHNVSVPLLSMTLSLYPLLCLCTHLVCRTSLHSVVLPLHSRACPLTRSPSSFGSHSLHQSLSSFPFLHLFYTSTFSHRIRTHVLDIWCLLLPLQFRNDVMQ